LAFQSFDYKRTWQNLCKIVVLISSKATLVHGQYYKSLIKGIMSLILVIFVYSTGIFYKEYIKT